MLAIGHQTGDDRISRITIDKDKIPMVIPVFLAPLKSKEVTPTFTDNNRR
jgi:hypothetical protein